MAVDPEDAQTVPIAINNIINVNPKIVIFFILSTPPLFSTTADISPFLSVAAVR